MRKYLDAPLVAFVVPMIAAASITSHGTYIFYSYFLPEYLAYAATVVLTAGIPLLEFAAVIDNKHGWRYVLGMLWLLIMESVAQYWQGQAIFVRRVNEQFPDPTGIDLAMWANHWSGRLLPIMYLASLSGIVVYFGYVASVRVKQLRSQPVTDHATNNVTATEDATEQAQPSETAPSKLAGVDVRSALARNQGNIAATAKELRVSRAAIDKWLKRNEVTV